MQGIQYKGYLKTKRDKGGNKGVISGWWRNTKRRTRIQRSVCEAMLAGSTTSQHSQGRGGQARKGRGRRDLVPTYIGAMRCPSASQKAAAGLRAEAYTGLGARYPNADDNSLPLNRGPGKRAVSKGLGAITRRCLITKTHEQLLALLRGQKTEGGSRLYTCEICGRQFAGGRYVLNVDAGHAVIPHCFCPSCWPRLLDGVESSLKRRDTITEEGFGR